MKKLPWCCYHSCCAKPVAGRTSIKSRRTGVLKAPQSAKASSSLTYQHCSRPSCTRSHVPVLEIEPEPRGELERLPDHLRSMIRKYAAFEKHDMYASEFKSQFESGQQAECPSSCLKNPPEIIRAPFTSDAKERGELINGSDDGFDVVLFCHSIVRHESQASIYRSRNKTAWQTRHSDRFPPRWEAVLRRPCMQLDFIVSDRDRERI